MTSRQDKNQIDTHFRIMHILQDNSDLNRRERPYKLGVSWGGLNLCLDPLIVQGLVKM